MLDKIQLFKVSQWILILYLFKGIILRPLLMPSDALSRNSSITRRAVLRLRKAVGILWHPRAWLCHLFPFCNSLCQEGFQPLRV